MRVCIAVLLSCAVWAFALQGDSVRADEPSAVGLWQQTDRTTGKPSAWFRVSEHDGRYNATLVKLFAEPGRDPVPLCKKCPGVLKNLPWLGLSVVDGMDRDGLNYADGTILDPRDGSEYFGRMQLSPDGQTLTVQGYLGVDPLGGDETWKRLPDTAMNKLKPGPSSGQAAASATGASGKPTSHE
jgi:hypothetical protein